MQRLTRGPVEKNGEFSVHETHRIPALPGNRMELSSEGMGWRDLYASVASEVSWSATLDAVDHFCLAYCVGGSANITRRISDGVGAHTALLRPGHFGSIPSGADTGWQVEGAPRVMLLYLRRSLIERVVNEVFEGDVHRAGIRPILGESEPLLEQLSLAVLSALRGAASSDRLYVDSLASTMAVQALYALGDGVHPGRAQQAGNQAVSRAGMRRVLEYIDTGLDQDLSLAVLAGVANYSTHFFARAFKRHMGESLHQYVLQRRIERVRHLLLSSDCPISQISVQAGFSSQSHMGTAFRRATGRTPGVFRRESSSRAGRC